MLDIETAKTETMPAKPAREAAAKITPEMVNPAKAAALAAIVKAEKEKAVSAKAAEVLAGLVLGMAAYLLAGGRRTVGYWDVRNALSAFLRKENGGVNPAADTVKMWLESAETIGVIAKHGGGFTLPGLAAPRAAGLTLAEVGEDWRAAAAAAAAK